jgi:hypothetical protein
VRAVLPVDKARHWHSMELAKSAIELGARLSVVSAFTGLPKWELRALFCNRELPAPFPGRAPWVADWCLKQRIVVEIHAAVFHAGFRAIRHLGYPAGDALVTSYKTYLRRFGYDPRVSFDRAFELVTHLDGLWTNEPPSLATVDCRSCGSTFIRLRSPAPLRPGACPFCRVSRSKHGQTLRALDSAQVLGGYG